jgi:hypothetical protein
MKLKIEFRCCVDSGRAAQARVGVSAVVAAAQTEHHVAAAAVEGWRCCLETRKNTQ